MFEVKKGSVGWNFDTSYRTLPDSLYTRINPVPVVNPQLVIANSTLAYELELVLGAISDDELAALFSGNSVPEGAEPIAQAYAGHQFGHFAILGDGRAHLLGEHVTSKGTRVDIQLKGSGQTPYSRQGDGRAGLAAMLREYSISEAMHALGIETTRSLAVVVTGEPVYREDVLPGAILTRVAESHIRVGTFEYLAAKNDIPALKKLADYAITRHYPEIAQTDQPYIELLKKVMERHISLVTDWLRVGFIHGVMNTDNMTISGQTIDYGPCAFMDQYDPQTVFSSIDHAGRYAYANQPRIAQWNIVRFAEALLPLLHKDAKQAASLAGEVIETFNGAFQAAWLTMMRRKLGLLENDVADEALIGDLLQWMQRYSMDYTNLFRDLIGENRPEGEAYQGKEFIAWWQRWRGRLDAQERPLSEALGVMRQENPSIIPRNHKVEEALSAAQDDGDFTPFEALLEAVQKPYSDDSNYDEYRQLPTPSQRVYQTFCGT